MLKVYLGRFSLLLPHARKKDALHGFVQRILQQELQTEKPLRIERYPQGKPYLPDYPAFFFNYSDSGDYAALAVSDTEVGIDLETIRPRPNYRAILSRFFMPEEYGMVEKADSEHLRLVRFFRLWTQKESTLKYAGCGLGEKIREYRVFENYALFAEKKLPLQTYMVQQRQIKRYDEHNVQRGDVLLSLCTESSQTPWFAPILSLPE